MLRKPFYLLAVACLLQPLLTQADAVGEYEECLLDALRNAPGDTTIAELRDGCHDAGNDQAANSAAPSVVAEKTLPTSPVEKRLQSEKSTQDNPFVITPHKMNYVLFASYESDPNTAPYSEIAPSDNVLDNTEIEFQLSLKVPVMEDLFGGIGSVYMAYTNHSYWQAYNKPISSPFRETNHEPEAFLDLKSDWTLFGWRNPLNRFSIVHQSNGQSGNLSRSWNRLYAQFILQRGDMVLSIKPWYRIPEDEEDDDNPDIDDFLGHGELSGVYKNGRHTYNFMLRNNFQSDNKGAVELGWTFPLYGRLRGYMKYFNGYGESLIDYNAKSHRLGFGVALTDWL